MIDLKLLPGQFATWSVHILLCALPSFFLALTTGFNTPPAIAGMLGGIATFIVIYALATSTRFYQRRRAKLLGRALAIAIRVRVIISLLSLPLLVGIYLKQPILLQLMVDFWCGYGAIVIVEHLGIFGAIADGPGGPPFLVTYVITVIEGVLVSLTLAVLCLFALWPISMRDPTQYGSD